MKNTGWENKISVWRYIDLNDVACFHARSGCRKGFVMTLMSDFCLLLVPPAVERFVEYLAEVADVERLDDI